MGQAEPAAVVAPAEHQLEDLRAPGPEKGLVGALVLGRAIVLMMGGRGEGLAAPGAIAFGLRLLAADLALAGLVLGAAGLRAAALVAADGFESGAAVRALQGSGGPVVEWHGVIPPRWRR